MSTPRYPGPASAESRPVPQPTSSRLPTGSGIPSRRQTSRMSAPASAAAVGDAPSPVMRSTCVEAAVPVGGVDVRHQTATSSGVATWQTSSTVCSRAV